MSKIWIFVYAAFMLVIVYLFHKYLKNSTRLSEEFNSEMKEYHETLLKELKEGNVKLYIADGGCNDKAKTKSKSKNKNTKKETV